MWATTINISKTSKKFFIKTRGTQKSITTCIKLKKNPGLLYHKAATTGHKLNLKGKKTKHLLQATFNLSDVRWMLFCLGTCLPIPSNSFSHCSSRALLKHRMQSLIMKVKTLNYTNCWSWLFLLSFFNSHIHRIKLEMEKIFSHLLHPLPEKPCSVH